MRQTLGLITSSVQRTLGFISELKRLPKFAHKSRVLVTANSVSIPSSPTWLLYVIPRLTFVLAVKLGELWQGLTLDQKTPYFEKADEEARLHKMDHPEYKYTPGMDKVKRRQAIKRKQEQQAQTQSQSQHQAQDQSQSQQHDQENEAQDQDFTLDDDEDFGLGCDLDDDQGVDYNNLFRGLFL
jgi:hypothetical protein